jgi:competence protein ComFC
MKFIQHYIRAVLEFIFPPSCIACQGQLKPDDVLVCITCWNSLKRVEGVVSSGVVEFDFIDEIRSGVYYDQKLQTLIHHFKYQRALALANGFAAILSEIIALNSAWQIADYLIPVPLHKVKHRERSYNQSEEIAKALSSKVQIPCKTGILLRGVNTVSQTQMADARERVKNMTDVFMVAKPELLKDKIVILIDDLITTGSTANACARILKEQGTRKVYTLTVGRPYFDQKIPSG